MKDNGNENTHNNNNRHHQHRERREQWRDVYAHVHVHRHVDNTIIVALEIKHPNGEKASKQTCQTHQRKDAPSESSPTEELTWEQLLGLSTNRIERQTNCKSKTYGLSAVYHQNTTALCESCVRPKGQPQQLDHTKFQRQ